MTYEHTRRCNQDQSVDRVDDVPQHRPKYPCLCDCHVLQPAYGRRGTNTRGLHGCVGYYDEPDGEPVYDPGWGSTPCLICWRPLGGSLGENVGGNIRTINCRHAEDPLSLFYRVHISCADAHPDEVERIDASVMHGQRYT